MARAIKAMMMKAMVKKVFTVPDKDDGDDGDGDNDGEEGEDNGDGDGEEDSVGDDEEDRITAALTLTRGCWSVHPASCDGNGDEVNGDEGDGDRGL